MEKIDSLNQVAAFHKTFKHPILTAPTIPDEKRCALRVELISEELKELQAAIEGLWADHALGLPPRPVAALPGGLSVVPPCLVAGADRAAALLVTGDLSELLALFLEASQRSGHKKKPKTRRKKTKYSKEKVLIFDKLVRPFILGRRGIEGLDLIAASPPDEVAEFVRVNKIEMAASDEVDQSATSANDSDEGEDDEEASNDNGTTEDQMWKFVIDFSIWYNEQDRKREEARIVTLHKVCVEYLDMYLPRMKKCIGPDDMSGLDYWSSCRSWPPDFTRPTQPYFPKSWQHKSRRIQRPRPRKRCRKRFEASSTRRRPNLAQQAPRQGLPLSSACSAKLQTRRHISPCCCFPSACCFCFKAFH